MGEARPDHQRPTAEFLAQVLRSALAQKNAESRGGRAMHQPSDEPPSQDAEPPDEKVVRLRPRRRPTTEQIPNRQLMTATTIPDRRQPESCQ